MSAIVLDTETTGIKEPQPLTIAFTPVLPEFHECLLWPMANTLRFRPTKPIEYGAMATHHILEGEHADCPEWPGQWMPPSGTEYVVGHNIDYDWAAIGSPHVAKICTLQLARKLWPELDSHSLGALTYRFQEAVTARELLRNAHDAAHDVFLCILLLEEIRKALPAVTTWHQLWVESERARVPEFMTFGKYGPGEDWAKMNGGPMRASEVRGRDPSYYRWLITKCDQVTKNPYYRKALDGEPPV